jgi:hypothetical protein
MIILNIYRLLQAMAPLAMTLTTLLLAMFVGMDFALAFPSCAETRMSHAHSPLSASTLQHAALQAAHAIQLHAAVYAR